MFRRPGFHIIAIALFESPSRKSWHENITLRDPKIHTHALQVWKEHDHRWVGSRWAQKMCANGEITDALLVWNGEVIDESLDLSI